MCMIYRRNVSIEKAIVYKIFKSYDFKEFQGEFHDSFYQLGKTYKKMILSVHDSRSMTPNKSYEPGFHAYSTIQDANRLLGSSESSEVIVECELKDIYMQGFQAVLDDIKVFCGNEITLLRVIPKEEK